MLIIKIIFELSYDRIVLINQNILYFRETDFEVIHLVLFFIYKRNLSINACSQQKTDKCKTIPGHVTKLVIL